MEEVVSLPPGFRFHPTDEELLLHYLKNKISSTPLPVSIITDVDVYKFNPWELPEKASFGEKEWYFFSPRDRKYPNGSRPNRAAASGYWKATGTDKPVVVSGTSRTAGVKKVLVFYKGRPPRGVKTNWVMHEYRVTDSAAKPTPLRRKWSLRLDDWVLCRIYQKVGQFAGAERSKEEEMMALQSHHKFQSLCGAMHPNSVDGFDLDPNSVGGFDLDTWDVSGGVAVDANSLKRNLLPVFDADNVNMSNNGNRSFNPHTNALADFQQMFSLPCIENGHAWLS